MIQTQMALDIQQFELGGEVFVGRPAAPVHHEALPVSTQSNDAGDTASLATVFHVQKGWTIDATALITWRTDYLDKDDVFRPEFLRNVVFGGVQDGDILITGNAHEVLQKWNALSITYEPAIACDSGPYLVKKGMWHTVWKVVQDPQLAFILSIWPSRNQTGSFTALDVAGCSLRAHGIAIPARSYSQDITSTHSQQIQKGLLKGLRVAVKDNFDIEGTRTSLCNRAYLALQLPQQNTAKAVEKLLNAGAHVVGKTYMSAFAFMEHPMQSVDFQASFNPRGDGYLICGGSSGGSAAAVAAYDFVDIGLCSDSEFFLSSTSNQAKQTLASGSARIPAFQTGVFGFRPSTNSISKEGLVDAWPAMDTPAWFGRDLGLFPAILDALSADKPASGMMRSSGVDVICPTDLIADPHPKQMKEFQKFLDDITKVTGQAPRYVSFNEDWKNSAPVENTDLNHYLHNTTAHGFWYSAYRSFDEFRQSYREAHGHEPFVTEVVRWYWYCIFTTRHLVHQLIPPRSMGSQVSNAEHQEITHRFDVFKAWFLERYMSHKTRSTVVAFNLDALKPKYRDEYPGSPNPLVPGLRAPYLAAILGAPELAIPSKAQPRYLRM
ncbi:MAG: hypothetical protein Q9162_007216 [Coniocarpon cinnabarinum]